LDRKISGPLIAISAFTMKHPPIQYHDSVAKEMVNVFIHGEKYNGIITPEQSDQTTNNLKP
jgi:myo-inositol-1-phosphate synthase